ncbi:hypothetical protein HPB51_011196 [Rhipicephalus microplus]|uniref:Uncharacterized protein n=1 Tax=Rhipicephalus microplus TaxID=6941 RepID=A0A9J6F207_RHIMP|nr:hypothetical protein HPB51_011196 [Rhipicephalus microplus]
MFARAGCFPRAAGRGHALFRYGIQLRIHGRVLSEECVLVCVEKLKFEACDPNIDSSALIRPYRLQPPSISDAALRFSGVRRSLRLLRSGSLAARDERDIVHHDASSPSWVPSSVRRGNRCRRIEHNKQWDTPEGSLGLASSARESIVCVLPVWKWVRPSDGRVISGRPEMENGGRASSGRRLLIACTAVRSTQGDDVRVVCALDIYAVLAAPARAQLRPPVVLLDIPVYGLCACSFF